MDTVCDGKFPKSSQNDESSFCNAFDRPFWAYLVMKSRVLMAFRRIILSTRFLYGRCWKGLFRCLSYWSWSSFMLVKSTVWSVVLRDDLWRVYGVPIDYSRFCYLVVLIRETTWKSLNWRLWTFIEIAEQQRSVLARFRLEIVLPLNKILPIIKMKWFVEGWRCAGRKVFKMATILK